FFLIFNYFLPAQSIPVSLRTFLTEAYKLLRETLEHMTWWILACGEFNSNLLFQCNSDTLV
ncbi:MAG: hypothetical protein WC071_03660, partial [Victivallaceae bacterium]